jgi:hypothetical protein
MSKQGVKQKRLILERGSVPNRHCELPLAETNGFSRLPPASVGGRSPLGQDTLRETQFLSLRREETNTRRAYLPAKAGSPRECLYRYNHSPAGRARTYRFNHSEKARILKRAYERSPKGRARRRAFDQTPKGKARHVRYDHTPRGKLMRSLFCSRPDQRLRIMLNCGGNA